MPFFDYLKYQNQFGAPENPNIGNEVEPQKQASDYNFKDAGSLAQAYIENPNDPILKEMVAGNALAQSVAYPVVAKTQYDNGDIDANELLRQLGESGSLSPEMEKYLDNQIARENTAHHQAEQHLS